MNGFLLEKMIVSQMIKKLMPVVGCRKYRASSEHVVLY
jgi:hypothetical protein